MFWKINEFLLEMLNSLWKYEFIWFLVQIFADWPILLIPIFLVTMRIIAVKNKNLVLKYNLMHIFYWCVIGITFSLLIQQFIHIKRPEEHLQWIGNLLIKHIPNASFPSDHATVWFAFIVWLYLFWYKKSALIFLPLMTLMVLSRIIAWVHWPYDIIAWIIIGYISAYISYSLLTKNKFVKKLNFLIIKLLSVVRL